MGPDPPIHQLRASDADREAAVGRLRIAAMEGRLDAEELGERVAAAYDAKWCSELERLTVDVTPAPLSAPAGPPVFLRAARTNGFAIASAILGVIWMWWMGSIAAVILGHLALSQIRRSHGLEAGRGLAIAGLTFGYLGLFSLLCVLAFGIGW
jgi:hypothetical protein